MLLWISVLYFPCWCRLQEMRTAFPAGATGQAWGGGGGRGRGRKAEWVLAARWGVCSRGLTEIRDSRSFSTKFSGGRIPKAGLLMNALCKKRPGGKQ